MGSAFLPPGGHFTLTRSKSFINQIVYDEGKKPGPGSYSQSSMPMPQGGRFNQSNPKSDIDWLVYHAKQRPGPGEYAPKRLSSDGGVISEARSKSALDWEVYRAEQIPGPGEYEHSSMPLPEGGRFNVSNAKTGLDWEVHRAKGLPGPADYDFPRWPCPSHGRFAAPKDQQALRDHLAPADSSDPPRPMTTLDQYRDGSFRLPAAEKRRRHEMTLKKASELKQKSVERHTREEFVQLRIARAKQKGKGTAEDAIGQIFDHLAATRGKVMDVFKKIDKDGDGTLTPDEFRLALQMMGLDLPRSQALAVVAILDEDGNGVIDVEEFVTKMRSLARERRAKAKAAAVIPDWIKQADAAKPVPWRDLGWRTLPPAKQGKQPLAPRKASATPTGGRPKSGSGTPFCPGGSGGRWRAPDGWQAQHTGWQLSTSSEFGVVERHPGVGSGGKEARRRIQQTSQHQAHRTQGNTFSRGQETLENFGKAARHGSSVTSATKAGGSWNKRHAAYSNMSMAILDAAKRTDEEIYSIHNSSP